SAGSRRPSGLRALPDRGVTGGPGNRGVDAVETTSRRVAASRTLKRPMLDKFKDECGVFGIFGHPEASNLTYLGLYALQHRGQESAGIAASDGAQIRVSKAMGYVNDAFGSDTLSRLPGRLAAGHVRYSTAGESRLANAQPIVVDSVHGQLAVCHNGNLV